MIKYQNIIFEIVVGILCFFVCGLEVNAIDDFSLRCSGEVNNSVDYSARCELSMGNDVYNESIRDIRISALFDQVDDFWCESVVEGVEVECSDNFIQISNISGKISKVANLYFKVNDDVRSIDINLGDYEINVLENGINNNKWLFVGDSYFDFLDGIPFDRKEISTEHGYKNHTDNIRVDVNGETSAKDEPSLGDIYLLGVRGITLKDVNNYFSGSDCVVNSSFCEKLSTAYEEGRFPKRGEVNRIAIYLGTNDASWNARSTETNHIWDLEEFVASLESLVTKFNELYDNPQIYLLRIFPFSTSVEYEEKRIQNFKLYNEEYVKMANQYENVYFVDTSYSEIDESNVVYQLLDQETSLIRSNYLANGTNGLGGHFSIEAYRYWANNMLVNLKMYQKKSFDLVQKVSIVRVNTEEIVDNPQTGLNTVVGLVLGILIVSFCSFLVFRKKIFQN